MRAGIPTHAHELAATIGANLDDSASALSWTVNTVVFVHGCQLSQSHSSGMVTGYIIEPMFWYRVGR